MGWFDDSDSEDETKKRRLRPLDLLSEPPTTTTTTTTTIKTHDPTNQGEEEEEEVDPLDAYMNGVHASNNKINSSSSGSTQRKHTRLDTENEDEATAHWTTPTNTTTTTNNNNKDGSTTNHSSNHNTTNITNGHQLCVVPLTYESMRAKAAMASTFHKAGEGRAVVPTDNRRRRDEEGGGGGGVSDDDGAYETTQAERIARRTIDPLAKVNHNLKSYAPFRKSFWRVSTTTSTTNAPNNHDVRNWRITNDITCSTTDIDPVFHFKDYGVPFVDGREGEEEEGVVAREVLQYLEKNGYVSPTPVQAQAVPVAMAGRDLLVTSQTGSGKTLAYILPLLTHILDQPHIQPSIDGPIALILTPTRELARQVHLVAKKLLRVVGATAVAVTGGMGTYEMTKELKKGCEVVVSTPGRFIDMVGGGGGGGTRGSSSGMIPVEKRKKAATNCDRITMVVLDEADKMLEMGFESQVGSILQNVRPDRQSLMFSATFGKKIERVAKGWLTNPVRIAVGRTGSSSEHVIQHVLVLPSREAKKQWLVEMYPVLANLGRLIIFVASRAACEEITDLLRRSNGGDSGNKNENGLTVDSIHGDRHQSDRNAALSKLRKGKLNALVATDVAARGLDVTDVTTVCNFDCAKNLDSHVHRVGRAGRLSNKKKDSSPHEGGMNRELEEEKEERQQQQHKKGEAYTLLTPDNADFANVLVEAFRREGREIGDDLLQLSRKSRYFGGGGGNGSKKWNRAGLGYHKEENDTAALTTSQRTSVPPQVSWGTYGTYGDGDEVGRKSAKRSRWGS